ncbi:MAG: hypothetical protein K6G62_02125 [Eubacterium sp.]|nr:hypothetical protein [Eubacterium sp.]
MINQDDRFYIMRIGKKSWVIVEILGVLIASIIWIFLINVMGCIASAGNMDWTDWRIYPNNMACMLIYLMGYTCIGLAVLLFHLLNIKALGTAIITTLMLLERFILYVLPNNIGLFLEDEKMVKVVNMVKKVTFMGRLESGYLSNNLHSSIIYFGVLAAVLIALNLIYVKKHEIG